VGLEYTLVNHQDKTCYELGKGSWGALLDANRKGSADLLYKESIRDIIVTEIWDYNIETDNNPQFWLDYAVEVASEIFDFINGVDPSNIGLANDSDDSNFEVRQKQYRWVGSRYREYSLDELNKHLMPGWVEKYGIS
jgi:hypothetical protein